MKKRLAYITSQFPTLYETFVLREIIDLSEEGFDILVFALKTVNKSEEVQLVPSYISANTIYVPNFLSLEIVKSQACFKFLWKLLDTLCACDCTRLRET
jgi:hypothetical protein